MKTGARKPREIADSHDRRKQRVASGREHEGVGGPGVAVEGANGRLEEAAVGVGRVGG
jgi:hypothetical protein